MADEETLKFHLRDVEQDIDETEEEIQRQKKVVRETENPFFRRYAEHVLGSYEYRKEIAIVNRERIAKELAEKKPR
jgi:hypothetical protein